MTTRPTTIVPFLVVRDGSKAIDFYTTAFKAQVLSRHERPDGKISAKISIDGAEFWVGDEEPEFENVSPDKLGGSPVRIALTVANPDAVFATALQAGATQVCPVTTEEFWKIGKLTDPFGHVWEIGCPVDNLGI
jgi:PhnB protein